MSIFSTQLYGTTLKEILRGVREGKVGGEEVGAGGMMMMTVITRR